MRFSTLTRMADQLMMYKYVVRNAAKRAGKTATFMPKPIFGDNGSGMHCHQSLWKDGKTLMADDAGYAGLSDDRTRLRRRPARARPGAARVRGADDELVPPARARLRGAGEPRLLAAQPLGLHPDPGLLALAEGEADRVPLPGPDGEPLPRLLGDADGRPRRDPRRGSTRAPRPTTTCSRRHGADVPQVPGSLAEALDALEADHEFLLAGGVFSEGLIRDLDRLEARERGRRGPAAPASAEFCALLRRLDLEPAVAAAAPDGPGAGGAHACR